MSGDDQCQSRIIASSAPNVCYQSFKPNMNERKENYMKEPRLLSASVTTLLTAEMGLCCSSAGCDTAVAEACRAAGSAAGCAVSDIAACAADVAVGCVAATVAAGSLDLVGVRLGCVVFGGVPLAGCTAAACVAAGCVAEASQAALRECMRWALPRLSLRIQVPNWAFCLRRRAGMWR